MRSQNPRKLIFSKFFLFLSKGMGKSIQTKLKQANLPFKGDEYISSCIGTALAIFIFFFIILAVTFKYIMLSMLYAFIISFLISIFIFFQRINYPKLIVNKRTRDIEKNLLPALRALLVQLNSGITFFDALNSIAKGKYGLVSVEFGKAVRDMQSGTSPADAMEKVSFENPSVFFRRVVWQMTTGMKAGSDISVVLKEVLSSLSIEQVTEIQSYGARLSPLIMFYMLIAVIMPAIGIIFIIILSSFMPVLSISSKVLLYSLLGFVVFLQIMFLGMLKSRRPALM